MWDRIAFSFDKCRGITGQDAHSFIVFEAVFVDPINGDATILENSSVKDKAIDTGRE